MLTTEANKDTFYRARNLDLLLSGRVLVASSEMHAHPCMSLLTTTRNDYYSDEELPLEFYGWRLLSCLFFFHP